MTTTLESHWQTTVTLEVLNHHYEDPLYTRKILLRHGETGAVVQFGIMQFNFRNCTDQVRQEILEQSTPLGRILITHGLLRRISTHALLEIEPDEEIRRLLDIAQSEGGKPRKIWGRLATIYVDEKPAVALLESLP
jgi:chorismate-pyruvate lyase